MPDFEHTADGLIVGVVDATLAMMGAVTMAESLGLARVRSVMHAPSRLRLSHR